MSISYKCGICGKEFSEDALNLYVEHVEECAKKKQAEHKAKEDNKAMNDMLEKIKQLESECNQLKTLFMEKYPKAYKMNFDTPGKDKVDKITHTVNNAEKASYQYKINPVYKDGLAEMLAYLFE